MTGYLSFFLVAFSLTGAATLGATLGDIFALGAAVFGIDTLGFTAIGVFVLGAKVFFGLIALGTTVTGMAGLSAFELGIDILGAKGTVIGTGVFGIKAPSGTLLSDLKVCGIFFSGCRSSLRAAPSAPLAGVDLPVFG